MSSYGSIEKLYSLQKFGIKLGLQNIENLLQYLGNPQLNFKSVHIAGSNGKGSTVSFIASILQETGYKTGLYTSPHFVNFNERIRVNSSEIPDIYIEKFVSNLEEFINKHKPTFFEVTTALAFKYFSDQNVELAVIETGLGGRFDATNIIIPEASVITSISLEHTEYLGNNLESIAMEKAGIIKSGKSVFIGRLPFEAEKVIEKKCSELNCPLFKINSYIEEDSNKVNFSTEEIRINDLSVPLYGNFQKYNASLAVLTLVKTFGINDEEIIQRGLSNVVGNSGIQGRYEVYNKSPRIIFDSAHNVEGVATFISAFKEEYKNFTKRILLFGAMKDKKISEMLNELRNYFDEIRFVQIDMERCASFEELRDISNGLSINFVLEKNPSDFIINFIKEKNKSECIVFLGSMYILGTIKGELLTKKKLDIFE